MWSLVKRIAKRVLPEQTLRGMRSVLHRQWYRFHRPHMLQLWIDGRRLCLSDTADITDWERLKLGRDIFIWHYSILDSGNGIELGDGCQIGTRVGVFTHSAHLSLRLYRDRYFQTDCHHHVGRVMGSVVLGEYTFVGPNSIIMPDTRIGRGSLVTAFSLVHGDFPEFSVISGNPAKVVGDTRRLDWIYLKEHPELRESYQRWTGQDLNACWPAMRGAPLRDGKHAA